MSSGTKARAAIVRKTGAPWIIEDVEVASPRDDEVLVRMVGTGICHTDIACRDGFPVPMPIVLGHEGSGVVEAVGSKVSRVKVGDHVVLSFDSCGQCRNCADHQPAYCFDFYPRNLAGVRRSDGSSTVTQNGEALNAVFFCQSSFATYAVAREVNTVSVDKTLPLEILGPLGCGVQTGAGASVNALAMRKGDSLAIFGGGAVGLSAMLGARAVDAGTVIVVEPNVARGKLALELGATHVINPKETEDVLAKIKELTGGGVNYALDTTGIPSVITTASEALLPKGTLGLIGVPPPEATVPVNMMSMLVRGICVRYIVEGDSDPQEFIPRMAAWFKAGKFPFDRLIKKFPFDQINEAAHASETGEVIKPVLIF
jgi:Zn-dependent alcohol dehydrogenase